MLEEHAPPGTIGGHAEFNCVGIVQSFADTAFCSERMKHKCKEPHATHQQQRRTQASDSGTVGPTNQEEDGNCESKPNCPRFCCQDGDRKGQKQDGSGDTAKPPASICVQGQQAKKV